MALIPPMIGQRLRRWREREGLSPQALADKAGVSREMISKIEAGTKSPGLETSMALAKATGIPLRQLISTDTARRVRDAARMLGWKPAAKGGAALSAAAT